MSFDLKGYEKDDNLKIKTFGLYAIGGVLSLVIIIISLSFYFFIMVESRFNDILMEGVDYTKEFKLQQNQILNSGGQPGDDGIESKRISIDNAIIKANSYYNE